MCNMKITTVLFDLDGTLLPMDQDEFVKAYFGALAKKMAPHGYDPKQFVDTIWAGTKAMILNDGSRTNEQAFWEAFCGVFGADARKDELILDDFYAKEFSVIQAVCGYNVYAGQIIQYLKDMELRRVLATNPIFPATATRQRIQWAGLQPEDFELYTTYENAHYCKPSPAYYREILDKLGLQPEECLMVGNDVSEDMVAQKLGMQVYLVTDCLINKKEMDIENYPHGTLAQLYDYLEFNLN